MRRTTDRARHPADSALYIGLISGTSLDGIDAALVRLCPDEADAQPTLHHALSVPYPASLCDRLHALTRSESITFVDLCELDTEVAQHFAQAALSLLAAAKVSATEISAIGSHGQTLYHHPDGDFPNTLQIGNPSVIAKLTGIDTVADLRRADMAAGGQGAPLLPALHQRLFADAERSRGVLNLGGIANLTLLPAGACAPSLGFDTGPANTLLDAWVQRQRGQAMDRDARWSSGGTVNEALLSALMADAYFARPAPKSTGVDYFNLEWIARRYPAYRQIEPVDVARTLVRLSAASAADAVNDTRADEVYVVGGGARNLLLVADLAQLCRVPVLHSASLGIDADNLEAMAFGWFAHCHLHRRVVIAPEITGARDGAVLGALYPAPQARARS